MRASPVSIRTRVPNLVAVRRSCRKKGVYDYEAFTSMSRAILPTIRHMYTLAIQPTLTYGAHAIHLKKTDLQLMEEAHARIIKTSLGLSKFSKTNPLLTALKTHRLENVVKVQTLNLLRRCMSGNSFASVFYWTIYKRGDTEGKTLMGRSHTILKQ